MGTIFHLLTLYSSLYKVSIDFEEINLYTYEFTIKNLVKTDNKIIKFLIKQKKENNFSFYNFIFGKYLGILNMENFDVIKLNDNIETKTFVTLLSREKFINLTDFVDCICLQYLVEDDIYPNYLGKKN
jgi:hypothetical protein